MEDGAPSSSMMTIAVWTRYTYWPPQLLPAITETNDLSAELLKLRQRGRQRGRDWWCRAGSGRGCGQYDTEP